MQVVSTAFAVVAFAAVIWGIISLFRRRWKTAGLCILGFIAAEIVVGLTNGDSARSSTTQASSNQNSAPAAKAQKPPRTASHKSAPAAEPTEQPRALPNPKAEEYARLDASISAAQIAGNAKKYVGTVVKLRCEISNVVEGVGANAMCGPKEADPGELMKQSGNVDYTDPNAVKHVLAKQQKAMDEMTSAQNKRGLILLVGDAVKNFDAHEVVTFLGTVQEPTEGQNVMGGNTTFPTVSVDFKL